MPGRGKPINKQEAQEILNKRKLIMDETASVMPFICKLFGKKIAANYYDAGANAFIFDRELIENLLMKKKDRSGAEVQADCVVVILGSQPKDDTTAKKKEGEPTVIIAACNQKGNTLTSLDIDEPAVEHPPTQVTESFPFTGGQNILYFDIV